MKRSRGSVAALLAFTLVLTSVSLGESPVDQALSARLEAAQQQQQVHRVQQQISQLKTEHAQIINELRTLHEEALDEQAERTAGTVEKLIAKLEGSFQEKVAQLEQQVQQLQIVGIGMADAAGQERPVAPDFTLRSFDGKTYTLSDLRGKIVVLEWSNDECPFCRYHYDTKTTMVDLANKYKNENVVWLAVNSTNHTTVQANLAFAKSHELPFPILDDRSGKVGRLYDAKTTPHMFVIDAQGHIAYNGAIDNAPMGRVQGGGAVISYVDNALTELISGKPVTTVSTKPYGCSVKYGAST